MANPQKENGYTPTSNELLEAIYKGPFNATQLKIILVILRYTYGFSRKEHSLSETFISKAINISKRYVSNEVKKLIKNKVVLVIQEHTNTTSRILKINKNYNEWLIGGRTIFPQVNNTSTVEQLNPTPVEQSFTSGVEQYFHQDKQNIKQIYDYYLTLGLIKHRSYTDDISNAIKAAMKKNNYTSEYCMTLLDRHKQVVELTKGEKYPVKARGIAVFFGQEVANAKHLICSEYEEGGKYYEKYLTNNENEFNRAKYIL